MTPPLLTPEQEANLTEALEVAKLFEQKAREMSELATVIADKYYKCLHETALTAERKQGDF